MSGHEELRAVLLVERAHPRRIGRNAEEWQRCAAVLEDAAARIDSIGARHSDIGGQTGPSMAMAMAQAADVLRVKARDLRRGGDALSYVSEATLAHQERKRQMDRDHPDDGAGTHAVFREEGSRQMADSQESALRHGIAVMKSIDVGDDPRRTPIRVAGPGPVTPPTVTWWPPGTEHRPPPPVELIDPHEWDDDDSGPDSLLGGSSTPGGAAPSVPGGASGIGPGALLGGAALGGVGAVAGARAVAAARGAAPAARGIGAGGSTGSGGVLGRSGGAGGAGGRGGAGAGAAGGRGGRRTKKEREGQDRDLYDDGDGWLDDDAGPGVLR